MHRSPADRARRQALHDRSYDAPEETGELNLADRGRTHLQALSRALQAVTDFRLDLVGPPHFRALTLRIVSPHTSRLAEDITCDLLDHRWCFLWSWGDVIGPVEEIDRVVIAIRHVLSTGPTS